jgi:hypothetical protein
MIDDPVILKLRGASGTTYEYHRREVNQQLIGMPGNYLFAREQASAYAILFVGQTESLAQHLASDLWEEAVVQQGATHLFSHLGSQFLEERTREQRDLIAALNPLLNQRYPNR